MNAPNPVNVASAFFKQVLKKIPTTNTDTADVVTVVFDLGNELGKRFWIDEYGQVGKQAAVSTSWAAGMQFHVPNAEAMRNLLTQVGGCPFAALVNAKFPAVPLGTEFRIGSRRQIKRLIGQHADHDAVHVWQGMVLVARVKAQTAPSTWQLIDRDIDKHTPQSMRVDYDPWLAICDQILPGLLATTRVVMPSASARVLRDGQPVGDGNGHTWVRIADAADVDRTKAAILARSITQDLAWLKPRFSRKTGEQLNGRGMWCCPMDTAVWQAGRLCFDGQPVVGEGLELAELDIKIVQGTQEVLDTRLAQIDAVQTFKVSKSKGTPVKITATGRSTTIIVENLQMNTVIELEDGQTTTVAQLSATTDSDQKVRCQAPFRASSSMAAFFTIDAWGLPRVFDVGTGCMHVLERKEMPGYTDELRSFLGRCVAAVGHIVRSRDVAEMAVQADTLLAIVNSGSWLPESGKVSFFNDRGRIISLTETDYKKFGQMRVFGTWIDMAVVEPHIKAIDDAARAEDPNADTISKAVREALAEYQVASVLVEMKLHRQVVNRKITVDMFTKRASMNFLADRQEVVLPFVPLRTDARLSYCTEDVIEAIAADYVAHWPMLHEWLDALVAARFAPDRRRGFHWLHAPADWGKGFLTTALKQHDLLFSASVKEVEKAMAGDPSGLDPDSVKYAWVMFVDEWKSVSREIKELNSEVTVSAKGKMRTTLPLFLKLFASAESVASLVQGGVEKQFADRFSLIKPTGGSLDQRPAFREHGSAAYMESVVVYIGRELMRRVAEYQSHGFKGAADKGDAELRRFHSVHGMAQHFSTMDNEIERVAEGVRDTVARYIDDRLKFRNFQGARRMTERLNACAWGFVQKGEGRERAIVTGNVEALIRAFLEDEGTAPSMLLKLDYKMGQIVELISEDRGGEKIRVYEAHATAGRGDGSKLKARVRGRVILAPDPALTPNDADGGECEF